MYKLDKGKQNQLHNLQDPLQNKKRVFCSKGREKCAIKGTKHKFFSLKICYYLQNVMGNSHTYITT